MMRFDRFTDFAQEAARQAAEIIQRYGHNQIDTEHILLALLEQPTGSIPLILEKMQVDAGMIIRRLDDVLKASPKASLYAGGAGQIFITPRVKRIIDLANEEASHLGDEHISTEHMLLAILSERKTMVLRILTEAGITRDRVEETLKEIPSSQRLTSARAERGYRLLEQYSHDLTRLARDGTLDPVVGRDAEIQQLIAILSRYRKRNALIVGLPGVGKTAIVHGLANCISAGDVPTTMLGKAIRSLDLTAFLTEAELKGELAVRVEDLVAVIRATGERPILFIDDLHEHLRRHPSAVPHILRAIVGQGDLSAIAAITTDGYEEHFRPGDFLGRHFTPLSVAEFSLDQTIAVLHALRPAYEAYHQIKITDEALETAVGLSDRYLRDRHQPDKSLDLVDEASALRLAARRKENGTPDPVSREDVLAVAARITGVSRDTLESSPKRPSPSE